MALSRFFLPFGAYSETRAPVVASSAPTPRPVMKRIAPKVATELIRAVMPMPMENQA